MSSEVETVLAGHSPDPAFRPISEEAMKMLEPSQNTLSSLEAQRVASVMEDCIHQVEVVAMLPSALRNLDRLSHGLNEELSAALRGHRLLVETLDGLEDAPTSPAPAGVRGEDREEAAAAERHRANLEKDLQASLRNVLRQLRAHPAALRVLKAEAEAEAESEAADGGVVSEDMQGLMEGLQSLHGVLVQRLLTRPEKERQCARYVREISRRHATNLEVLASLEEKVAVATQERDEKVPESPSTQKHNSIFYNHVELMRLSGMIVHRYFFFQSFF